MSINSEDLQRLRLQNGSGEAVKLEVTRGYTLSAGMFDVQLPVNGFLFLNNDATIAFIPSGQTTALTLKLTAGLWPIVVKQINTSGTTATITDISILY